MPEPRPGGVRVVGITHWVLPQSSFGTNSGKSVGFVCKNLLLGIPKSHQNFPMAAAPRESLRKFYRKSLKTFQCFSDFWFKIVKIMRPRVNPGKKYWAQSKV
jgi:hypothetical protein